jgi:predicted nucleic acid-binding protein
LAAHGQFALVLSSVIILETWRKLLSSNRIRARYIHSDERAHRFCRGLLCIAEVVRNSQPVIDIVRDSGRRYDPRMRAVAGNADAFVSRDKDLLSLGTDPAIPIITPKVFRQQLRDAD